MTVRLTIDRWTYYCCGMTPPPLREPSYFVLASLLDEPLHGYAIIKQANELSEGRVRMTAGTLYGALDRLADEGLIEVEREEVVQGRPRRYYRLTGIGAERLSAEAARLSASARVVADRLPVLKARLESA